METTRQRARQKMTLNGVAAARERRVGRREGQGPQQQVQTALSADTPPGHGAAHAAWPIESHLRGRLNNQGPVDDNRRPQGKCWVLPYPQPGFHQKRRHPAPQRKRPAMPQMPANMDCRFFRFHSQLRQTGAARRPRCMDPTRANFPETPVTPIDRGPHPSRGDGTGCLQSLGTPHPAAVFPRSKSGAWHDPSG